MKVVINRCYGGFGLSAKAIELFLKKHNKECFFYKQTGYAHEGNEEYTKVETDKADDGRLTHVMLKEMGEKFNEIDNEFYYYESFYDDRNNTTLIETVEELGIEAASGDHAELDIVEIPDGINYTIDEYDGIETIHEAHRSW